MYVSTNLLRLAGSSFSVSYSLIVYVPHIFQLMPCSGCVMKTTNYWDQQTHDDRPQQTVHTSEYREILFIQQILQLEGRKRKKEKNI